MVLELEKGAGIRQYTSLRALITTCVPFKKLATVLECVSSNQSQTDLCLLEIHSKRHTKQAFLRLWHAIPAPVYLHEFGELGLSKPWSVILTHGQCPSSCDATHIRIHNTNKRILDSKKRIVSYRVLKQIKQPDRTGHPRIPPLILLNRPSPVPCSLRSLVPRS